MDYVNGLRGGKRGRSVPKTRSGDNRGTRIYIIGHVETLCDGLEHVGGSGALCSPKRVRGIIEAQGLK